MTTLGELDEHDVPRSIRKLADRPQMLQLCLPNKVFAAIFASSELRRELGPFVFGKRRGVLGELDGRQVGFEEGIEQHFGVCIRNVPIIFCQMQ